jgi:hypothetical protein
MPLNKRLLAASLAAVTAAHFDTKAKTMNTTKSKTRVACSPLTGIIYAGRPNKDGTAWAGEKHDVTSDVLGALIEKVGPGNVISVNENGKPAYEIEVRKVSEPNPGQQGATGIELEDSCGDTDI